MGRTLGGGGSGVCVRTRAGRGALPLGLDFTPDVMGRSGEDRRAICAGLWPCTEEVRENMARKVEEHQDIAEAAARLEFVVGA